MFGSDSFLRVIYQNNFFILKKLFLTLAQQNDLKTPKNINLNKNIKNNF